MEEAVHARASSTERGNGLGTELLNSISLSFSSASFLSLQRCFDTEVFKIVNWQLSMTGLNVLYLSTTDVEGATLNVMTRDRFSQKADPN